MDAALAPQMGREQLENCRASFRVIARAEVSGRFVEQDGNLLLIFPLQNASVDPYPVLLPDPGGE